MDKNAKELFDALVNEMGRMEERIDARSDARFSQMDRRIDNMEVKFENAINNLQHEVNALKLEVTTNQFIVEELRLLKHRVDDLEKRGA